mgnify:FL=1
MTKGFACDTDEMRALITKHEALRSDLERVVVPPKGAAWGFSVVRGGYKELAEDCAERREIMQEWCTRMSEAIEATSRESEQADATWAEVIKDARLPSLSSLRGRATPRPSREQP